VGEAGAEAQGRHADAIGAEGMRKVCGLAASSMVCFASVQNRR
jgi:hypothetical protein